MYIYIHTHTQTHTLEKALVVLSTCSELIGSTSDDSCLEALCVLVADVAKLLADHKADQNPEKIAVVQKEVDWFWTTLFPNDNGAFCASEKFHSQRLKEAAFDALNQLALVNSSTLAQLLRLANQAHEKSPNHDDDYEVSEAPERIGVGLRNLANTCYINSLLQQIFMVPGFVSKFLSVAQKSDNPPIHVGDKGSGGRRKTQRSTNCQRLLI